MDYIGSSLPLLERDMKEYEQVYSTGSRYWESIAFTLVRTAVQEVYMMCHNEMRPFNKKPPPEKYISAKAMRLIELLQEYNSNNKKENDGEDELSSDSGETAAQAEQNCSDDDEDEDRYTKQQKQNEKRMQQQKQLLKHPNVMCGIAFVDNSTVAMMLEHLLNEFMKKKILPAVRSSRLEVGGMRSNKPGAYPTNPALVEKSDFTSIDKNKREQILRSFRRRFTNLLITPTYLEDCWLTTRCNLVINFNVPPTYCAYVISKSQCRAASSNYAIFAEKANQTTILNRIKQYKRIEETLSSLSSGQPEHKRAGNTSGGDSDNEAKIVELNDSYITPFKTSKAVADDKNAIKLVNKYCGRLPNDGFTPVGPRFKNIETDDGRFFCEVRLPVNSHVRSLIRGSVSMPTVPEAQQATAVEVCRCLYQGGELDDNLSPRASLNSDRSKELIGASAMLRSSDYVPSTAAHGAPGSSKRRQTYCKRTAECLQDCLPVAGVYCRLYEVEVRMRSALPERMNLRRRKRHLPEDTTRCFGLITCKAIPHLPRFPVFTRAGEERVALKLIRNYVVFDQQHIELIRAFHKYIFSDVLRLERANVSFRPESATSQQYLVALNTVAEGLLHLLGVFVILFHFTLLYLVSSTSPTALVSLYKTLTICRIKLPTMMRTMI